MRVDRIKLFSQMVKKDIGATALADRAGLSRATVSAVRGGKSCTDETAIKIAKALGCDVTDLIEME